MLATVHVRGRRTIIGSLALALAAFTIPTVTLAAEVDVLQHQCKRETEAWHVKKRGITSSCKRLEKLLRDKAYKDRGERPPKDEEEVLYIWNNDAEYWDTVPLPPKELFLWNEALGMPCRYTQTGEMVSCPLY